MDLNAAFRTHVSLLEVLDNAAFTEGVEALGDGGGFDQITPAHGAGDVAVKVSDQAPPPSRHGDGGSKVRSQRHASGRHGDGAVPHRPRLLH